MYQTTAVAIVVSILLIGVYYLLPSSIKNVVGSIRPVFWLKTTAVLAFSCSWLTKGHAIFSGHENESSRSAAA